MLDTILEAIVGILFGGLLIVLAQQQKLTQRLYALTLISLPMIYVSFGLFSSRATVIWTELLYGLPFLVVGLACFLYDFKYTGYIVAATWFLHGCYDMAHDAFFINPGVPAWYPVMCLAVDFVVGSWILYQEMAGDSFSNPNPR